MNYLSATNPGHFSHFDICTNYQYQLVVQLWNSCVGYLIPGIEVHLLVYSLYPLPWGIVGATECYMCAFIQKWSGGKMDQIRSPGRFLGITTGWDPSVGKSNRFACRHPPVILFKLGYMVEIPLKWSIIFLQSPTSTGYFSNSTGSSVTDCRFSQVIDHLRPVEPSD